MSAKSHPATMRFIPDLTEEGISKSNSSPSSSDMLFRQPSRYIWFSLQAVLWLLTHSELLIWPECNARCLILRTNGELSLLDLDDGHEQVLTNSVELFWVTCGQSEKENLIEEVSWLDYGHRGMQVCKYMFLYRPICSFSSISFDLYWGTNVTYHLL